MKKKLFPALIAVLLSTLLCASDARAQGDEEKKTDTPQEASHTFEIGAHYSLLRFDNYDRGTAVGGRLTYNFSEHVAAEGEVNVFPFAILGDGYVAGGRPFQAQFGVKAGKRFRKFGVFGKARPGLMTFDETYRVVLGPSFVGVGGQVFHTTDIVRERKTHLTFDVGGVVEFYPSRRLIARFDLGDTIIRYGPHTEHSGDSLNPIIVAPTRYDHNLQFGVGVGVRLGRGGDEEDDGGAAKTRTTKESVPRFEAGAQFTSLSFSPIRQLARGLVIFGPPLTRTEMGFGGRFTFNLNDYLAAEAETNFLPREGGVAVGASGRVLQGQFGVKAGKRWNRFGVFAKARPGFVSFGSSLKLVGTEVSTVFGRQITFGRFDVVRRSYASADLGGVLELYPSRRFVLRFDAGDTIIWYGARHIEGLSLSTPIVEAPPETRHNFQFSSGIGFRF